MKDNRGIYRAKAIDSGSWVFGYYTSILEPRSLGVTPKRWVEYITTLQDGVNTAVFKDTLCQITGKEDYNAHRAIFENDYLRLRELDDVVVKVIWDDTTCGFKYKLIMNENEEFFNPSEFVKYTIIGNAIDNPEMESLISVTEDKQSSVKGYLIDTGRYDKNYSSGVDVASVKAFASQIDYEILEWLNKYDRSNKRYTKDEILEIVKKAFDNT